MSYGTRLYLPLGIDNVEDIDEYRPGGFHPVQIGDVYHNRYKILHKLGCGGFSTTWLARDNMQRRYVALKLLKAEETANNSELRILQHLASLHSDHPAKHHIRFPLDNFALEGPNGKHCCLVTEVAGPSLSEIYNVPRMGYTAGARRLRAESAHKINRQLVDVVEFLHSHNICHGDLTLPNVLLKMKLSHQWQETEIYNLFGEPAKHDLIPVDRSSPAKYAPRYIVEPAKIPSAEFLSDDIFLVDFGEAFAFQTPPVPEIIGIPSMYRAPETIFDSKYDWRSEIWALGCVIFEIRAGNPLFYSIMGGDDEIIMQMVQMSGKLPKPWWSRWERRTMCFDEDGKPLEPGPDGRVLAVEYPLESAIGDIGAEDDEAAVFKGPCSELLEQPFQKVPQYEADAMRELLSSMLEWQPERRMGVEEVRKHRWIAS